MPLVFAGLRRDRRTAPDGRGQPSRGSTCSTTSSTTSGRRCAGRSRSASRRSGCGSPRRSGASGTSGPSSARAATGWPSCSPHPAPQADSADAGPGAVGGRRARLLVATTSPEALAALRASGSTHRRAARRPAAASPTPSTTSASDTSSSTTSTRFAPTRSEALALYERARRRRTRPSGPARRSSSGRFLGGDRTAARTARDRRTSKRSGGAARGTGRPTA